MIIIYKKDILPKGYSKFYERYIKRLLDIILSLFLIVILLPIFFIISLLSLFYVGSPIIFTQERPGYNGEIFELYKFRTMLNTVGKDGKLLDDEYRMTRYGKILRSTSLDELPELINILKGDMSFVGPRPLLVEYMDLYDRKQIQRHNVRPGLTGLAQVNGRNNLSWQEKFDYDLKYIKDVSLLKDFIILIKTVKIVLIRTDVNQSGMETVDYFRGNKHE